MHWMRLLQRHLSGRRPLRNEPEKDSSRRTEGARGPDNAPMLYALRQMHDGMPTRHQYQKSDIVNLQHL